MKLGPVASAERARRGRLGAELVAQSRLTAKEADANDALWGVIADWADRKDCGSCGVPPCGWDVVTGEANRVAGLATRQFARGETDEATMAGLCRLAGALAATADAWTESVGNRFIRAYLAAISVPPASDRAAA